MPAGTATLPFGRSVDGLADGLSLLAPPHPDSTSAGASRAAMSVVRAPLSGITATLCLPPAAIVGIRGSGERGAAGPVLATQETFGEPGAYAVQRDPLLDHAVALPDR